jgi:hypothetical protein
VPAGPLGPDVGPDPTQPNVPGEDLNKEPEEPDFWLVRFFDFSVEQGKSYRYRICLVLRNPNYAIDSLHLEPDVAARKEKVLAEAERLRQANDVRGYNAKLFTWWALESKPSEPTPVISVPRDYDLLAVSVKAPLAVRPWDEPAGSILVVKWVESAGKEVFTTKDVRRGDVANYVANFPEDKASAVRRKPKEKEDRNAMSGEAMPGMPGMEGAMASPGLPAGPGVAALTDVMEVDYRTNAVVLDMMGGLRLAGPDRLTSPGQIILFDNEELVIRDEMEDLPEFTRRTAEPEPEETGPGMMPGGPGSEMMMPGPSGLEGLAPR